VVVITDEHLRQARRLGACLSALRRLRAGDDVVNLTPSDAAWVSAIAPDVAYAFAAELCAASVLRGYPPLDFLVSGDGYGDGSG